MKKLVLLTGSVLLAANVVAHQIKDDAKDSSWNWNNTHAHTHEEMAKSVESSTTPAPIRGMQALDAIAKVGECYTPAYVEPSCSKGMKKVIVEPYKEVTEVVPAVTKQVEEKVLISEERVVEEVVPALYENVSKKVMISPERTVWKKGNFTATTKQINGETYCLVTEPAVYETKVEKVLRVPASTTTRTIPAVYKTYMKTVEVTPATTKVVKRIPAVYKQVSACVDNQPGYYEWRSVLCEQNATKSILRSVEEKLADGNFLPKVAVDGVINDRTTEALKSYQRAKGLKVDGLVSIDTVKSLGVSYK